MKTRNGFVSNSSSSSFILDRKKFTIQKLKKALEQYIDIQEELTLQEFRPLDSMCTFEETNIGKIVDRLIAYYEDHSMIRYLQNFDPTTKVIYIGSTDDNSIPASMQSFLEDLAIGRIHWG